MIDINLSLPPANDNEFPEDMLPNCTYDEFIAAVRAEAIDAMDHDEAFLRELEDWSTRDDNLSPDRPL